MLRAPQLRVQHLRKRFGGTEVLHGVDLVVEPGSFVGLMGPNGAGKSTLIKILAGVYDATSGSIEVDGQRVGDLSSRSDVGFIHQDLGLLPTLSIADNLRIGREPIRRLGLIDHAAERRAAEVALGRVGLHLDPRMPVGELGAGQQALVAVARALDSGARLLIVDEATSTLVPRDSKLLIDALRELVASGASVVMVSHKLQEVIDSTRRIVVLIDGLIASDHETRSLDVPALVALLSDSSGAGSAEATHAGTPGTDVLTLVGAASANAVSVDLRVRRGEVVGLTGQPGSGLYDVAYLAAGTVRPNAGRVDAAAGTVRALVPPHRESQGGMPTMSVSANLTLTALARWRAGIGTLRRGAERGDAARMAARLSVVPADVDTEFGVLSGGNKQKVIFGRALFARPDLYVLCEPTRGVDVRTRREIYTLIREIAAGGAAVLVVSSDAEDLFSVCDRVGVVEAGRVGELHEREELTVDDLKAVL